MALQLLAGPNLPRRSVPVDLFISVARLAPAFPRRDRDDCRVRVVRKQTSVVALPRAGRAPGRGSQAVQREPSQDQEGPESNSRGVVGWWPGVDRESHRAPVRRRFGHRLQAARDGHHDGARSGFVEGKGEGGEEAEFGLEKKRGSLSIEGPDEPTHPSELSCVVAIPPLVGI